MIADYGRHRSDLVLGNVWPQVSALGALVITGLDISLSVLIGMLLLSGIAVENSMWRNRGWGRAALSTSERGSHLLFANSEKRLR